MSDLISRQAAIDAVKKNTFRLTFAEEQNCEGHVAWSAYAAYSDVIEGALLELPSVQPDYNDEVKFWKRRAEFYEKTCLDLFFKMSNGMKFDSIELNENGIVFTITDVTAGTVQGGQQ